jgi:hypothetical protein
MVQMRELDKAERTRQIAKIVDAVTEKLQAHGREIGSANQIQITCLVRDSTVEVKLQTTYH